MSVHNSSQWKLWSDVFKNTCEEVDFQKSCITCNLISKLPHRYLSWILTAMFHTTVFQSTSFSEHVLADILISIKALPLKLKTKWRWSYSSDLIIYEFIIHMNSHFIPMNIDIITFTYLSYLQYDKVALFLIKITSSNPLEN